MDLTLRNTLPRPVMIDGFVFSDELIDKILELYKDSYENQVEEAVSFCGVPIDGITHLKPGEVCKGTSCNVQSISTCSQGEYVGAFHTHTTDPNNPLEIPTSRPSPGDILNLIQSALNLTKKTLMNTNLKNMTEEKAIKLAITKAPAAIACRSGVGDFNCDYTTLYLNPISLVGAAKVWAEANAEYEKTMRPFLKRLDSLTDEEFDKLKIAQDRVLAILERSQLSTNVTFNIAQLDRSAKETTQGYINRIEKELNEAAETAARDFKLPVEVIERASPLVRKLRAEIKRLRGAS